MPSLSFSLLLSCDFVHVCIFRCNYVFFCVIVCVCVREREKERECVSVCVCAREKEKEEEKERNSLKSSFYELLVRLYSSFWKHYVLKGVH